MPNEKQEGHAGDSRGHNVGGGSGSGSGSGSEPTLGGGTNVYLESYCSTGQCPQMNRFQCLMELHL